MRNKWKNKAMRLTDTDLTNTLQGNDGRTTLSFAIRDISDDGYFNPYMKNDRIKANDALRIIKKHMHTPKGLDVSLLIPFDASVFVAHFDGKVVYALEDFGGVGLYLHADFKKDTDKLNRYFGNIIDNFDYEAKLVLRRDRSAAKGTELRHCLIRIVRK